MQMKTPTSSKLDRALRKIVPSSSMLSYNPVFKVAGNLVSGAYSILSPLTRKIPPNHLRVRVGMGNELLFNHSRYLTASVDFWLGCIANGYVTPSSDIVDIGIGCGRYAHVLRDFNFYGQRYSGTYTGIDIDAELLEWCRAHFDANRFRFMLSGQRSTSYKGSGGVETGNGMQDLPENSQDLVFSRSLYSHLLEDELRIYSTEAYRVLRPGQYMLMSYFSLTSPPPTYGNRHTFQHKRGLAHIESEKQPTAAIAYHDEDLRSIHEQIGFSEVRFTSESSVWQQMIIARK